MRLLCFMSFLFVALGLMGGIGCICSGYKASVATLRFKADSLLTATIERDVEKRSEVLKEEMVFGTYTSPVKLDSVTLFSEQGQQKYRKEEPLAKAEILKEGLYTILPLKNPICIDTLNRLFYKEVQKSDLKIVFALSLVDRLTGDTIHSHLSFVNMLTAHSDSLKIKTPENDTVILHVAYDLYSVIAGIDNHYWFNFGGFFFFVFAGIGIFVWKKFRSDSREVIEMTGSIKEQDAVHEEVPEEVFNMLEAETVPAELVESEKDILRNSSGELTLCISTRKLSAAKKTVRLSKGHEIRAIQTLLKAEQLSLSKEIFICNVWLCQDSVKITENAFTTGISRLNAVLEVLHVKVVVTENTVSLSLIG